LSGVRGTLATALEPWTNAVGAEIVTEVRHSEQPPFIVESPTRWAFVVTQSRGHHRFHKSECA
jgi:hypothetical protein